MIAYATYHTISLRTYIIEIDCIEYTYKGETSYKILSPPQFKHQDWKAHSVYKTKIQAFNAAVGELRFYYNRQKEGGIDYTEDFFMRRIAEISFLPLDYTGWGWL